MTDSRIVTLNAGSSSLRCAIFDRTPDGPKQRLMLSLYGLPSRMIFERHDPDADKTEDHELDPPDDPAKAQETARAEMLRRLDEEVSKDTIAAVSHRIVHGGQRHSAPVRVDEAVLSELDALSPLAPSHQPYNLAGIREFADRFADVPQIGCFDTAFHSTLAQEDRIFAIPRDLTGDGILRYGFHGLSYEQVAKTLRDTAPDLASGRVVVGHLGHGVSMCAMKAGESIATTMGMTALDGLPMGRRPGALDPGIVLYLIEERGMTPREVREMLYERSGLLGLSGISSEMKDLLDSDEADAAQAVNVFVYRCQREIGSLTAALGGLDGLVFTGGMAEYVPEIRRRICDGLGWLGIELDEDANAGGEIWISPESAKTPTLMIPTDEEAVLARGADKVLRKEEVQSG